MLRYCDLTVSSVEYSYNIIYAIELSELGVFKSVGKGPGQQ